MKTGDKGDAFNGDAAAQVRVAADLDGAKTAGRKCLEPLVYLCSHTSQHQ